MHLEVGHALEPDLLIAVEDLEGLGDGGAVYDTRGERDDVGRAGGGRVWNVGTWVLSLTSKHDGPTMQGIWFRPLHCKKIELYGGLFITVTVLADLINIARGNHLIVLP